MAKLGARGRTAIWRMRKDYDRAFLEAKQARENAKWGTDFICHWTREKVTYAYMSDGTLMKNLVTWSENKYYNGDPSMGPKENRHDFGWKICARKVGLDKAKELHDKYAALGFTEEYSL
jgi:hypothetical protein